MPMASNNAHKGNRPSFKDHRPPQGLHYMLIMSSQWKEAGYVPQNGQTRAHYVG